ncbi:MAG: hypothetical protein EB149_05325 [Thaumarchaeota archaeon]|nr:hypothetical protein [Nitrososphaerota archaeon]
MIDPPDVRIGENATAWLFVTNTGTTKLLNVTAGPILVNPSSTVVLSSPQIQSMSSLSPAESRIMAWKYTLMGSVGTNVTFSGNATAIDEATNTSIKSNMEKQMIYLRDNNGLGTILTQTLLSKPEIFMILRQFTSVR